MKKSKLTLVIDGNWLLMSRLSVIKAAKLSDEELGNEVKSLMVKSIKIFLKKFPMIDNVIMVADGGSWRCDVEIPKFIEGDEVSYKGTRESDPNINWDVVFVKYGELIESMADAGFTTCREFGIEGDDWCWYLSRTLNAQGTNVIIWSMDKDLTQLVQTSRSDGTFTVCWNKLYMTKEKVNEDEIDFLLNWQYSVNEDLLNKISNKAKEVREICPRHIVIDKILRGDVGDNVFPIILKRSKSNPTKSFRISTKDINWDLDIFDKNEIISYIDSILESKSYKGKVDKSAQDIFEHFLYNRKLVFLDESSYPIDILNIMRSQTLEEPCTNIADVEQKVIASAHVADVSIFDEI